MLRTLRVYWPIVRITAGSSFGPITTSATTPMSRNSVQLISNMETPGSPLPRACAAGRTGVPRCDQRASVGRAR